MSSERNLINDWFSAVERGNLPVIQRIFSDIDDIDVISDWVVREVKHKNVTALVLSSYIGIKDVVRWFIQNKANVNASTQSGWRSLHFAAAEGHVSTVDMLCQAGALVDVKTAAGESPIFFALKGNMRDTVRKLLSRGSSIDDIDENLIRRSSQRGILPHEVLDDYQPRRRRATSSASKRGGSALASVHDASLSKRMRDTLRHIGEESRTAKLVQRLAREEEPRRKANLASRLAAVVADGTADLSRETSRFTDALVKMLELVMFETPYSEDLCEHCAQAVEGVSRTCWREEETVEYLYDTLHRAKDTKNESLRGVLLTVAKYLLKDPPQPLLDALEPATNDLMLDLYMTLDTLEFCDNLPQLLGAMLKLGSFFPGCVSSRFELTIEIIVGWAVSPDTSAAIMSFLGDAFRQFPTECWRQNGQFTVDLITSLVGDVSSYARGSLQQHAKADKDRQAIEILLLKMERHVFVSSRMIQCLFALGGESPAIEESKLIDIVSDLLDACSASKRVQISESFIEAVNRAITSMMVHADLIGSTVGSKIMHHIMAQIHPAKPSSLVMCPNDKLLESIICMVEVLLDRAKLVLTPPLVFQILGPYSVFHNAKLSAIGGIAKKVVKIMENLVCTGLSGVPDIVYQVLLSDLEIGIRKLVQTSQSNYEVALVQENAFFVKEYSTEDAETLTLFNMSIIELFVRDPRSMWTMEPSIFDLYVKYLPILDEVVLTAFPRLHLTLASGLCKIAKANNFFNPLTSSVEEVDKRRVEVLDILCKSLRMKKLNQDVCVLLLSLLCDLLTGVLGSAAGSSYSEIELALETLCEFMNVTQEPVVQSQSVKVLIKILKETEPVWSRDLYLKVGGIAFGLISHSDSDLSHDLVRLLACFPLEKFTVVMREAPLKKYVPATFSGQILSRQSSTMREYMSHQPEDTFQSNGMKKIFNALVFGSESLTDGLLRRLFYVCRLQEDEEGSVSSESANKLAAVGQNTEGPQWFWAIWQTAWYCVSNKLKIDPWFKPQETFLSIENTLKEIRATLIPVKAGDATSFGRLPWNDQLKQVSLLMLFLDSLEKLMYNAYEGSATSLAAPPKPVRTFFRMNRATCLEWLNRIRLMVMMIAEECDLSAVVVRNGLILLQETDGRYCDTEDVLCMIARSMRRLGNCEPILGLFEWARGKFGLRYDWLIGLAKMTAGRIEEAVPLFEGHIKHKLGLRDEKDAWSKPEIQVLSKTSSNPNASVKLCCREILDCYQKIGDFQEMLVWKTRLEKLAESNKAGHVKSSALKGDFEWSRIRYLADLQKWEPSEKLCPPPKKIDLKPKWNLSSFTETLDYSLVNFLVASDSDHLKNEEVAGVINTCASLVRANSRLWPSMMSPEIYVALQKAGMLLDGSYSEKHRECSFGEYGLLGIQLLRYHETFETTRSTSKDALISQIGGVLPAIKWARQHNNWHLAEDLILRELVKVGVVSGHAAQNGNGVNLIRSVQRLRHSKSPLPPLVHLEIEREAAKVLWSSDRRDAAVHLLSDSMLDSILTETGDPVLHSTKCELNTKSMLTIFRWLHTDSDLTKEVCHHIHNLGSKEESALSSAAHNLAFLSDLTEIPWINGVPLVSPTAGPRGTNAKRRVSLLDSDSLSGCLLMLASRLSAKKTKSWFTLANWCFKRAQTQLSKARETQISLTTEQRSMVEVAMPVGVESEEVEKVIRILGQVRMMSRHDDDDEVSSTGRVDGDQEIAELSSQLISCCPRLADHEDAVTRLVSVWRQVLAHEFTLFFSSARAYFTFLSVNDTSYNPQSTERNITATLRIMRILVKHSVELRDMVVTKIPETPTSAWVAIIPQLFARLNHPEAPVRQCMVDLLCRMAANQDTAHQVVYPAVVGALRSTRVATPVGLAAGDGLEQRPPPRTESRGLRNDEEVDLSPETNSGPCPDDLEEAGGGAAGDWSALTTTDTAHMCFTAITEALSRTDAGLVEEMHTFVEEMRRVTLLWHELWLGALSQHFDDLQRKIAQLEAEIQKVEINESLSKEEKEVVIEAKHEALLRPCVYTLERLAAITGVTPETPHEQWFQENFAQLIKDSVENLKHPINASNPQAAWQIVKQLYQFIHQCTQKHTGHLLLRLSEISPKLAKVDSAIIPMPGLDNVKVAKLHNSVQILPTKTKPKKLIFVGSDGRKYPYLFKGLEDLHLDERIMQFLSIVNYMFSRLNKTEFPKYMARNYSVTPLGPRSGLIQMVERATPLFTLYKKWQQRQTALSMPPLPTKGVPANEDAVQNMSHIARPSEVLFSKLKPALEAKGIRFNPEDKKDVENRKDWPLAVLRDVLLDLMKETPNDLLSKELWCSSLNSQDWWNIHITFARSSAVMSIIGYVIGLGDRHLDNVMVDLSTGEIVHIDYNVCFEKGRNLKVPERVPFRLTQNLQTALGLTGVEGMFRLSCEAVLRTMRTGSEILLTLLEAFVYDPLVDWTPGNESGYTASFYGGRAGGERFISRRELERDINWKFLGVRVMETKAAWKDNGVSLVNSVEESRELLTKVRASLERREECRRKTSLYTKVEQLLKTPAERSSLATVLERCATHTKAEEARLNVVQTLTDKELHMEQLSANHKQALSQLFGDYVPQLVLRLQTPEESIPCFHEPARDFLTNAGKGQIVTDCDADLAALKEAFASRHDCLKACFSVLNSYKVVVGRYNVNYSESDRCASSYQLLKALNTSLNHTSCEKAICAYTSEFPERVYKEEVVSTVLSMSDTLQEVVNQLKKKLASKLSERMASNNNRTHVMEQQIFTFLRESGIAGQEWFKLSLLLTFMNSNKACVAIDDLLLCKPDEVSSNYLGDLSHLCSTSKFLCSFLPNLRVVSHEADPLQGIKIVVALEVVLYSLKNMQSNMNNVILPEATRILSSEESETVELVSHLARLASESQPLLDHFDEGAASSSNADELKILSARLRREIVLMYQDQDGSRTSSQMLLFAMCSLLEQASEHLGILVSLFRNLYIPDAWYYVDVLNAATNRLSSGWGRAEDDFFMDAFFFRGVRAMLEVFRRTRESVSAFQQPWCGEVYMCDEDLSVPIDDYIHFACQRILSGIAGTAFGHLACSLMEDCGLHLRTLVTEHNLFGTEMTLVSESLLQSACDIRNMDFGAALPPPGTFFHPFVQAKNLLGEYETCTTEDRRVADIAEATTLLQNRVQCAQKTLASFQWLHEEVLVVGAGVELSQMVHPSRSSVMGEMKRSMVGLVEKDAAVVAIWERLNSQKVAIEQRLRWAMGANPKVAESLTAFLRNVEQLNGIVSEENDAAQEVIKLCGTIGHFELRRTRTADSTKLDDEMLVLLRQARDVLETAELAQAQVTELEISLVHIKNELSIPDNDKWIETLEARLRDHCASVSAGIVEEEAALRTLVDGFDLGASRLKSALNLHGRLLAEVKVILKTLTRLEEPQGHSTDGDRVRAYLSDYRRCRELLNTLVTFLNTSPETKAGLSLSAVEELSAQVDQLCTLVPAIYSTLVEMAPKLGSAKLAEEGSANQETLGAISNNNNNSVGGQPCGDASAANGKGTRHQSKRDTIVPSQRVKLGAVPVTNVCGAKNTYAVNVWRRIHAKLDGMDAGNGAESLPTSPLSVEKQVDAVIRQATDLDNLALMYEGWTAWV